MNDKAAAKAALDSLRSFINERAGLAFSSSFEDSAAAGIQRVMKRYGIKDAYQFRALVDRDDQAFDALIAELTIGETYFFREPRHFDFLRTTILPDLQARYGYEQQIRIWSAGCATGEEPYSLAMLMHDLGLRRRSHILATDVSQPALERARAGTYTSWSLRGEHYQALQRYLQPGPKSYQVAAEIRTMVQFRHLNLAMNVYPSFLTATNDLDVIFCRNVMIYFDQETVHQVVQRFFSCLRPGGWLILASSDPSLIEDSMYQNVANECGVFYRKPFAGSDAVGTAAAKAIVPTAHPPWAWAATKTAPSTVTAQKPTPVAEVTPPTLAKPLAEPLKAKPPLAEAEALFARGQYAAAAAMTATATSTAAGALLHLRALANTDAQQALTASRALLLIHTIDPELHFLQVVLLVESDQIDDAIVALRRVLYLDRTLAMAHFLLGQLLRRRGDEAGALRAFRNVCKLCEGRPGDELVPLADGERAAQLAAAAAAEINRLQPAKLMEA